MNSNADLTQTGGTANEFKDLFARASKHGSATIHEAYNKAGALDHRIKPICSTYHIAGPAVPVRAAAGENLAIHKAIYACERNDILVVFTDHDYDYGYWGEIMSEAAQERGLRGLIIDACVRDYKELLRIGFPVFCRGLSIKGTRKDTTQPNYIIQPLLFGEVVIAPGDLIVADADGVVSVARKRISTTLDAADDRLRKEGEIIQRIRRGESTLDIYGWN